MYIGTSIFLIAVGAILRYAVTATVAGIDVQTAGLILMVVGVIGLLISLALMRSGQIDVDAPTSWSATASSKAIGPCAANGRPLERQVTRRPVHDGRKPSPKPS